MLVIDKMIAADEFDSVESINKLIEKSGKFSKSENLKSEKLSKSQKLAKSGKKLSKSRNLPNFNIKKNGPSFLNHKARVTFNRL